MALNKLNLVAKVYKEAGAKKVLKRKPSEDKECEPDMDDKDDMPKKKKRRSK